CELRIENWEAKVLSSQFSILDSVPKAHMDYPPRPLWLAQARPVSVAVRVIQSCPSRSRWRGRSPEARRRRRTTATSSILSRKPQTVNEKSAVRRSFLVRSRLGFLCLSCRLFRCRLTRLAGGSSSWALGSSHTDRLRQLALQSSRFVAVNEVDLHGLVDQ